MSKLTLGEQIQAEIAKSHKSRNAERFIYYTELAELNIVAASSYEQFKGSWAHACWLKKNVAKIAEFIKTQNKRFGYLGEWI